MHAGDYLGEREDFSLKVMHAYVDAMEFSELEFDQAIRTFLNGFRCASDMQHAANKAMCCLHSSDIVGEQKHVYPTALCAVRLAKTTMFRLSSAAWSWYGCPRPSIARALAVLSMQAARRGSED